MNGTYINDIRIESNKEYELKENDKLQLANSEFVLVMS
ncbi:MAG: FHA domain-containing protein [Acetivibrionales bacterium]